MGWGGGEARGDEKAAEPEVRAGRGEGGLCRGVRRRGGLIGAAIDHKRSSAGVRFRVRGGGGALCGLIVVTLVCSLEYLPEKHGCPVYRCGALS